jgi:hypothetical protein
LIARKDGLIDMVRMILFAFVALSLPQIGCLNLQSAVLQEGKVMVLDFEKVLKEPNVYDGKRIRIVGYKYSTISAIYPNEAVKGEKGLNQSIWLGGTSAYANPEMIDLGLEGYVVIEGTFVNKPSGNMNLWNWRLDDITKLKKATP